MERNLKLKLLVLIVGCGVLLIFSQQFLSRFQKESIDKESDLYLPEVNYLRFISLGHDGLVSDLVLARALTYYGSHYFERRTFGFKHLKKLLFTAVEMDPMNKDAFLIASNILSDINIQYSIDVLKLGMFYHPQYWKFPEMIGFRYFFYLNDSHNAAKYYEMASQLPDHPPYVPSLSGKFYQESGRYEEAIRVLYNFYSTTADKRLKESFKESIAAIQEKIKNRDFQLKATIRSVPAADVVEFQPDPHNPQFQLLKPLETLKIKNIETYDINSADEKERLFAHFQQEYAEFVLANEAVSISFDREADGSLKRNKKNQLSGSITLKNNRPFQQIILHPFPPQVMELNLKKIYQQLGKIVSLRFTVHHVQTDEKGKNILLNAASGYRNIFAAVIPMKNSHRFITPNEDINKYFKRLLGKRITVTGFAGLQGRQVQIRLYLPLQLEIE